MDLYILNEVNKLKGGGAPSSAGPASIGQYGLETSPDPDYPSLSSWVSFYSENRRYHSDSNRWDSGFPGLGTFYVYVNGVNDMLLGFWNSTGHPSTNEHPSGGDQMSHLTHCQATHNTLGQSTHTQTMHSGNDYSPWSSNLMWVRNPTDSNIVATIGFQHSEYWNNGYEGASLSTFTPNSTDYSGVTTVQPLNIYNHTGNSDPNRTANVDLTFPANKTIAVLGMANSLWWTNSSSGGLTFNANQFYNLQNLQNAGLHCDQQMSQVYAQYQNYGYRSDKYSNNSNNSIYRMYNDCGAIFGDR